MTASGSSGFLSTTGRSCWSKFYEHFDYGGRVGYALTLEKFSVGVFGGYHRRNISFGDYISQANAFTATASVDLNFEAF